MKIACTGLLPGRLSTVLIDRGVDFISCDFRYPDIVRKHIKKHNPDVIIHTAAATGVDWCEDHPQEAIAVNVRGVDNIVSWWKGRLIYISTDYVFDGRKWFTSGYSEKHAVNPVNVYGQTKLAGEMRASSGWSKSTVVRTTVLYGGKGPSFVTWVLDQFDKGESFTVSSKMITTPTNVHHLAEGLFYVLENNITEPVINIAGETIISRHSFARMIGTVFGKDLSLLNSDKELSFGKAKRPTRAGLRTDLAKKLGIPIYSALEGLQLMKETHEEK